MDQPRQHPTAFALATRHIGEVDVDLIHAAVFHHRRDLGHDVLEGSRVLAVLGKVYRQQNRLRAQPRRLHQAHGRAHAKLARWVSGSGDHAAPGVAGQPREEVERDAAQVGCGPAPLGPSLVQPRQQIVLTAAAAPDNHWQPLELGVAQ